MEIINKRPDELRGYERNARTHSKDQVKQIAASITAFGFNNPILIDGSGMVIAGHCRLAASIDLGRETVPCVVLDHLSDAEKRAYILADNKLAALAGWDDDLLRLELGDLLGLDVDLPLIGFDSDELKQIMTDQPGDELTDPDDVPDIPDTPETMIGDVWLMGKHRLMCGDSQSAADVALLMDGKTAGLMNTDPPYGISYNNDDRPNPGVAKPRVAKPRVANDTLQDEKLQHFLEDVFSVAISEALEKRAAWYLWHAHLTQGYFAAAAAAANLVIHRQIIWVKPVLLLGRGHYHWKHEPCFMGWVKGFQPPDYGLGNGERTQVTVWEVGSVTHAERKEFNHSSPKPVGLFEVPLVKHLKVGGIAYEPFAGSGPQFIAAEKTMRVCYGMELMPNFCDVIVTRWQNFTGQRATHAVTGRPFGE
jgi:DNA modification methylase